MLYAFMVFFLNCEQIFESSEAIESAEVPVLNEVPNERYKKYKESLAPK